MAAKRILLADDEIFFRELVEEWIETFAEEKNYEIEVVHSSDGKEAMEKFDEYFDNEKPFDVAVIDYFMPKFFGTDVLKHIVKKYPIPIIIISGAKEAEKIDFIEEGAIIFETKPLSYEQFQKALKDVIDIHISTDDMHLFDDALIKLEEVVAKIEKRLS